MFNNNANSKKETNTQMSFDVVMGSNTKINGNIDSEGSIRIDGVLNGDIIAVGDVIIGSNAEINGNINASNIDISGIVNGNINASNTLKIYESGRLNGDFECSNLHISEGGFFSGNCIVRGNIDNPNTEETTDLDADNIKANSDDLATTDDDEKNSNNSKKFKKKVK